MKNDNKLAWRIKTVAAMGQINLSERVHSGTRPDRRKDGKVDRRSWKKQLDW
jgi:hypothetical protein